MLGKVLKKNAVLPGGPAAAAGESQGLPPPIIGKRFPTYAWTDLVVKFPGTSALLFLLPVALIAFMNVSLPLKFDVGDAQYTIQFDTYKSLNVTMVEKLAWDSVRLSSRATEASQSQTCTDQALFQMNNAEKERLREGLSFTNRKIQHSRIYIIYTPQRMRHESHKDFMAPALNTHSIYDTPKFTRTMMTPEELLLLPITQPLQESTVIHPNVLDEIQSFEGNLMLFMKNVQDATTCWTSNTMHSHSVLEPPKCAPLTSFMGYMYPGQKVEVQTLDWPCANITAWENSGVGNMTSPRGAVEDLLRNPDWKWFVGERSKPSSLTFPALRSQLTLALNMADIDVMRNSDETISQAIDHLDEYLATQRRHYPSINIAWGGPALKAKEVRNAFKLDQRWLMLSFTIQVLAVARHAHSFVIGVSFVMTMWLTISASSFLFRVFTRSDTISIMYMLSYYTVMPFTTSSAYVFTSSFLLSGQMASHGRLNVLSLRQRLAWVYRKAGVAVVVSTLVVLVATGVTTMVPIPAVSGFSLLMLIEVVLNAYVFLTVFPSIIVFHHLHFSNRRRNAQRLRELANKSMAPKVKRHPHFVSFVRELWQLAGPIQRPHKKKKAELEPVKANHEEDFRRNRRKQTEEYITHVPVPFSFVTEDSSAVLTEKFQELSEENDWNAMPWETRRALWGTMATRLNFEGQVPGKLQQLMEVVNDAAQETITIPIAEQVMHRFETSRTSSTRRTTPSLSADHVPSLIRETTAQSSRPLTAEGQVEFSPLQPLPTLLHTTTTTPIALTTLTTTTTTTTTTITTTTITTAAAAAAAATRAAWWRQSCCRACSVAD